MSQASLGPKVFVNGNPVQLGKRIGKGGEGEVYFLADDPRRVVKLYTLKDLTSREAKVRDMVRAQLHAKTGFVAFPIEMVLDAAGRFSGFLMRAVPDTKPLHELYSPGSRKKHFPQVDYRFLVRVALNTARALASVHETGCVVGDINHSGILISDQALVTLIDADSFQFSLENVTHLCKVGVPEYTPPEIQGLSLSTVTRTTNHDCFGLAVVIFQLLFMGRHPFVGTVRKGDIPELDRNIKDFRYAYSNIRNVGLDQPPGTPEVDDFSDHLSNAFEKSFSPDGVKSRPTAREWVRLLESFESVLVRCSKVSSHYFSRMASDCPWCEMESAFAIFLFIPKLGALDKVPLSSLSAPANFNLEGIQKLIASITLPSPSSFPNLFGAQSVQPSSRAKEEKGKKNPDLPLGVAIVLGSIALLVSLPSYWIAAVIGGYFGFTLLNKNVKLDDRSFLIEYQGAGDAWNRLLHQFQTTSGFFEFEKIKMEADSILVEYRRLNADLQGRLKQLSSERRARQLHNYLERFELRNARIKGIGPAKIAVLISYGIDTAAEITERRVLGISGFGPTYTKSLMAWRKSKETAFTFRDAVTPEEVSEANRLRSESMHKEAELRGRLLAIPQNLIALRERVIKAFNDAPPVLLSTRKKLLQARSDLEYLGIPVPQIAKVSTTSLAGGTNKTAAQGSARKVSAFGQGALSCPRCGNSMVRRTARKGRNAGSSFWGCSRYPSCKGTRSI